MKRFIITLVVLITLASCEKKEDKNAMIKDVETPFIWEAANLYFLLTDRFNNADISNDVNFERTTENSNIKRV